MREGLEFITVAAIILFVGFALTGAHCDCAVSIQSNDAGVHP